MWVCLDRGPLETRRTAMNPSLERNILLHASQLNVGKMQEIQTANFLGHLQEFTRHEQTVKRGGHRWGTRKGTLGLKTWENV